MAEPKEDVKIDSASSPGQGVKEGSPASADVKSQAQPPSAEPKHEDAIPYSRFKEQVDKMKQLEAELAEERNLREQLENAKAAPEEFDWNIFSSPQQQQQPQQQQAQQPYSPEEIEARLREDIANKPLQTIWPLIMEGFRQGYREEKRKEAQIRTMPGFRDVEDTYYEVPDDLIAQAQSNPELIRFLLAKHRAGVKKPSASPKAASQPSAPATPPPGNGNPPASMEELAEQYRAEGERRALEKLRNQQGLQSEGAHSYSAPPSDDVELDDAGRSVMAKLGIPQDRMGKVANRLASFMKGE